MFRRLFLCLLGVSLSTWAGDLEPGTETALALGSPADKTLVYVPSDYRADRDWPVLLYYHGTNGQPDTRFMRQHLGGQHAVVIGMAYREPGLLVIKSPRHMSDYTEKEHAHLNLVLGTLKHRGLRLDPRRIYVSGISKGGWITSLLGHSEPKRFAGLALLMGGRHRTSPPTPDPAAFRRKPIYIGVGANDNNYVFSRLGEAVWGGHGANITFDTWPGIGHEMPDDLSTFRFWLLRELAPKTIAEESATWLVDRFAKVRQVEAPFDRYIELLTLLRDPRYELGPRETREALRTELNGLVSSHSDIRAAALGERRFKETMAKEMKVQTLAQMKFVRDAYADLQSTGLEPSLRPLVDQAHERVADAYARSVEASRAASAAASPIEVPRTQPTLRPQFPGQGSRRVGPPVIR